jgi:hypothetical protein
VIPETETPARIETPPENRKPPDPPPVRSAEAPVERAAVIQSPPPAAIIEKQPPPPPLPAVSERKPENGYVINPEILRESRILAFAWEPAAGADAYVFTLFRETGSGERQLVISSGGPETSYTLEDLSLLDLGRFVWQVEAVSLGDDGTVLRNGIPGENWFAVDIPLPDIPRGRDPGVFYGR